MITTNQSNLTEQRASRIVGRAAVGIVLTLGMPTAWADVNLAINRFNSNREGWTVVNNGDERVPHWSGSSSRFIFLHDHAGGPVVYFNAPSQYLGNKYRAYGSTLSYRIAQTTIGTRELSPNVLLSGGGITLTRNFGLPGPDFITRNIVLDETGGWRRGNVAATASDFRTVLSNLGSFRIKGDLIIGGDVAFIDDVILRGDDADAPVAVAGGLNSSILLDPIELDGSASFDPDFWDEIITYSWDVDNDGVFDFSSSSSALSLNAASYFGFGLTLPGSYTMGLRVRDGTGLLGATTFDYDLAPIPAPGAALLGLIGMSAAGWVRRRLG